MYILLLVILIPGKSNEHLSMKYHKKSKILSFPVFPNLFVPLLFVPISVSFLSNYLQIIDV